MTDILGRMGNILRANLNDMLDHAEDPEKMIDQLVRDYTNDVSEAESAVAQTVGNLRLTEDDLKQAQDEVNEWGAKAAAAAQRGSQSAAAGNTADAARFDDLAKTALRQQIAHEDKVKLLQEQVAQQTVQVDQLKAGLNGMRAKLEELQTKRDELAARAKMAEAQRQVQESVARASTASIRPATSAATRTRSARTRRWPRAWPRSVPHPSMPSSRISITRPATPRSRRAWPRSRAAPRLPPRPAEARLGPAGRGACGARGPCPRWPGPCARPV